MENILTITSEARHAGDNFLPVLDVMKRAVIEHYLDELDRLHRRSYGDRVSDAVYAYGIQEMESGIQELIELDEADAQGVMALEKKYRAVLNELADAA